MRRILALLAVIAVVASAVTALTIWRFSRDRGPQLPEISAYSHGHTTRVGPYQYCEVLNLNACQRPGGQGELRVNDRDPVQLSVPTEVGQAPWRLLRVYDNPNDTTEVVFRPGTRLAATIPTVDPYRGRLTGFAVQLLTLVLDPNGELVELPHAEWSVRTVWS